MTLPHSEQPTEDVRLVPVTDNDRDQVQELLLRLQNFVADED